jgi:hypothetical protein
MASGVSRREVLRLGALGLGAIALGRVPSVAAQAVAPVADAARRFLDSLDGDARAKATYAFDDDERFRWHWTNTVAVPRNGLPLSEMTSEQRQVALDLLRSGSSSTGYRKATDIMKLQGVLLAEFGASPQWDPQRYYVSVFGEPGGAAPWGWRFEGHHVSRHFVAVGDRIAVYPFFLGAWPTRTTSAFDGLPAGYRTMPREEDAARELVRSLGRAERRAAVFQQESLTVHVTSNKARVTPLDPVGIRYDKLGGRQRRLVTELLRTYLSGLPDAEAKRGLARIERAGIGKLRFGWAGSLTPHEPQYWRLQGPTFLLEFDNSRNDGTHIHSVWRDFAEDFGRNLA